MKYFDAIYVVTVDGVKKALLMERWKRYIDFNDNKVNFVGVLAKDIKPSLYNRVIKWDNIL